jgi:hypothetical protein
MGGRIAVAVVLGLLLVPSSAQAVDFSLQHKHSGQLDATAQGTVTFGANGGATISVTVTDRNEDGWCADAWVSSNLPASTHKVYEACGVAQQRTYTLNLPATSRCNITFVEVQVGRVDHSNNDKTELGDAKRMPYTCPPVATPTPVRTVAPTPVPTPAPPPPPPAKVVSTVSHYWVVSRHWTRDTKLLVRRLPAGATVQVRCQGHGCFKATHTVAIRGGHADVHRWLRSRHLRSGAFVEVRITAPNMVGKVMRFKVRSRKLPIAQRLCLQPGATAVTRC